MLTALAVGRHPGATTILLGGAAIVLWGATVDALPPMLQAAAMRTAPDDPDGASGLYVAMFQVGIMAGSLVGRAALQQAGVAAMISASTALIAVALGGVTVTRGLFDYAGVTSEK